MANDERTKYVPMGMNMTLAEVAELMGISRERVRQIESRALGKLRRRLQAQGYNAEDVLGEMIETPAKPSSIRPD